MSKFFKSIWVRVLAPVLCTISGIGMIISILATVFYAGMGGTEEIYKNIYDEIADGYAMYAVDEMEAGDTKALAEYLTERGIACSITKISTGSGVETLEFSCGELREGKIYERDLDVGGYRQYSASSLFAALVGYNYGNDSLYTVQSVVRGYAFDREAGLFYYETEQHYFL